MANSPGGSDRPADNNDAPTDNDSITNTPSANSVTSGPNHAEIHVPARRFDAAGSMAYIGFFAHAQAMSKSCGTPEGTVSLAEIENQDDAGDENNGQPDNNVAATDKVEPLAHKPSAFEPAGSSVPRQVFYSAEDAANNNTEASDKVEKYVRIRGEKQLALQAHQRQLNDAREKVKEQQDQLDNASLTEEERLEVEGRRAVERGHLNKHLGNVWDTKDALTQMKRNERVRRRREGGPPLSESEKEDEEESEDNSSDISGLGKASVKDEPVDDGFTSVPVPDSKRKATDKIDSAGETKKQKTSRKAGPSLRSVVKRKKQGEEYKDAGTDSEDEDKGTADKTVADADNKSEDDKGKEEDKKKKKKKREPAITATNPKSVDYENGIPIPVWDEQKRAERTRSNNTVRPYDKGNENADKNAAPRQRKDALAIIDKNTVRLSQGEAPSSYRSGPYPGNYDYWNILYLQTEAYGLAMKGGARALKLLKSAGGSLGKLSNTQHPKHGANVKEAVQNLQELYKSMKRYADKAEASADNQKGSQSQLSAKEAAAERKRRSIWDKVRESNLKNSFDGASDFDDDSSSYSAVN